MTDWAERATGLIAENLKRIRARKGLSAAGLAANTANLGHPISRSVISDIENGRKKSLAVTDFLVLASALDVLPLELLYGTQRESVEVLPGQERPLEWAWHDFNAWSIAREQPVELMKQYLNVKATLGQLEEALAADDSDPRVLAALKAHELKEGKPAEQAVEEYRRRYHDLRHYLGMDTDED